MARNVPNPQQYRLAVGLAIALLASWALAQVFAGSASSTVVPLWFIAVLYLLARRFGVAVGIVGSLMCAGVFAHFLFNPTGSFLVQDTAARQSLLWMVVGTIVTSYLLVPSRSEDNRP